MDRWVDGSVDGWADGWMDGWMDRWVDGWVDGWMRSGWIGGWMNGWVETHGHTSKTHHIDYGNPMGFSWNTHVFSMAILKNTRENPMY